MGREKRTVLLYPADKWEGNIKLGRNEICPCGSGKKFKNCHQLTRQDELTKHLKKVRGKED